jgi:hypothetical protein
MRASFADPQGPMTWRVLPYLGAVSAFCIAVFGLEGAASWILGVLALSVFNLLGVISFRQRKARDVEVLTRPGSIEIKQAGTRNQHIHTKDITGATTARTSDGVLLTLAHAKRDQPVTLRVANDAEAGQIRQALGIGHGGFGIVGWRSQPTDGRKSAVVGRIFAAAVGLFCISLALLGADEAAAIFGAIFGVFAGVGMLIGIADLMGRPNDPSIVMTSEGLRLRTVRGWFALPYDAVLGVDEHKRGVVFTVPPPYGTVGVECSGPTYGGVTAHDREVLVAQIQSASQRARGLGPQKVDVSERLDVLRRNGESPRDWLTRLDMQGRLLTTAPGYRGNTLDSEDLWAILEDPEADAELRAAAARVLRHSPHTDARPRIDAAVAAVRDEATTRRFRIAISDDIEAASQELSRIEADEQARQYTNAFVRRR